MQSNVKYPKFPTKINWNTKHSQYPDQPVMTTEFKNLENIQPTIMWDKVEGIMKAIKEGQSFDPFILYPNSFKIFDGNHRYFAIKELWYDVNFKVPYIEQITEIDAKTMEETKSESSDIIKRLKTLNDDLQKIINDLKKDQPVMSTTEAVYNPVHSPRQRPADEHPSEPTKPDKPDVMKDKIKAYIEKEYPNLTDFEKETLQECVNRKIPIIVNEHPEMDDHDQIIAIAYSYCREQANKE
jgi:hypothetical protein